METRLRELRKKSEKTLQVVADELGITTQVLSRYERGDRNLDNEMLKMFANYYNVSIDYLLMNESTEMLDLLTIKGFEPLPDFTLVPLL